jgi:metal-responsive CopG/Arc/MetJ family transcriptional regulator
MCDRELPRVHVDLRPLLPLIRWRFSGHTIGMKVAVSIPDDVFAEAEALAKRMNSSRSEIYSRALGEFIGHHASDRVTNLMNEVIDVIGDKPDAFSAAAAKKILKKIDW